MKREDIIPANYTEKIVNEELKLEIYNYEHNGKFVTMGFKGRQAKPSFHFNFKKEDSRDMYIDRTVAELKDTFDRQKAYTDEKKKAVKNVKVGDVFVNSWGYDQSNYDFYQIVAMKGQKATFREIHTKVIEELTDTSAKVSADIDNFKGEEFIKNLRSDTFLVNSYSSARKIDNPLTKTYTQTWGR